MVLNFGYLGPIWEILGLDLIQFGPILAPLRVFWRVCDLDLAHVGTVWGVLTNSGRVLAGFEGPVVYGYRVARVMAKIDRVMEKSWNF